MSERMRKVSYEPKIKVYVDGQLIFETDYLNSLYVYRMPFIKSASFSVITFPIGPKQYADIDEALKKGKFPTIITTFNLSNMDRRRGKQGFAKLSAGMEYACNIIHALPRTNMTSQSKVVPVTFYIAQLYIHSMSIGNSFNKIFEDIKSYDALLKFEDAMKERFNGQIQYRKIVKNHNDYKYESILMKSATDITIPNIILNTYKPYNSLCYYFFDDFDSNKSPVVGILHDVTSPGGEPWHIFEDDDKFDITRSLRFKGQIQLGDKLELLKRSLDNTSIYMRNKDSITYVKKESEMKSPVPTMNIETQEGTIFKDRKTKLNKVTSFGTMPANSNQHASIYAPDSFNDALSRYDTLKKFIDNTSEAIYKFEVFETHIDAIQFYRKYTFDQTDLRSYYVPINIVNVFSRVDPHQTPVSHTAQFQCIKYPSKETLKLPF